MPEDNEIESIEGCAAMIGSVVLLVLAEGFVLATMWAWFMVPTFGLPALGYLQALGVSLTMDMFVGPSWGKEKKVWKVLSDEAKKLVTCLVIGWIVHKLM